MANIFISHSSKDNDKAKEIFQKLQSISQSIFLDFDFEHGIKGGQKWEKELYKRVKQARIMVVAISPNWLDSNWCYKEYCLARAYKKIVIPVIIEDDKRIEKWDGKDIQHFDLVNDKEAWSKLEHRVEELTKDEIAKIYKIKDKKSPYPGLKSFEKEEAGFFYGRNEDIINAVDELNAMADLQNKRFLNIIGASGVGKSSFIKAGVLPYLEFLHSNRWVVLDTFRAKESIIRSLAIILSNVTDLKVSKIEQELYKKNFKEVVNKFELILYDKLQEEKKDISNIKFLLPIDQAEEILNSSNKEEKEILFEFLQYILTKKDNFYLVWTLRSDQLKRYQDDKNLEFLRDLSQDFILNPISMAQIETIIKEPLFQIEDNIKVSNEVIEQIKQDIKSTTSLPLLAYLLQQLYSYVKEENINKITLKTYQALSQGSANPIESIINTKANDIYKTIKDKSAIKSLFLEHLIKINIDKTITKKAINIDTLPPELLDIADKFTQERLFIKYTNKNETVIEIAHEALIFSWDKLKGWISGEEEFLIFKTQLELFYQDWIEDNKSKRALLKGLTLDNALKYKSKIKEQKFLDFIQESQDEVEREKELKEKDRKTRRNLTFAFVGAVGTFGSFSFWKSIEAEKAKNIADDRAKKLEKQKQVLKEKSLALQEEVEKAKHNIGLALLQRANVALQDKKLAEANLFAYGALEKLSEKLDKSDAIAKAKSLIMNNKYVPVIYSKEVKIKSRKWDLKNINNLINLFKGLNKEVKNIYIEKYINFLLKELKTYQKVINKAKIKFKTQIEEQNLIQEKANNEIYALLSEEMINLFKIRTNKFWKRIDNKEKSTDDINFFISMAIYKDSLIAYSKSDFFGIKNSIIIQSLKTNKKTLIKNAHKKFIRTLAFSPDSKLLASSAEKENGIIKIWNRKEGKLFTILDANLNDIQYLKFLDNKTLLSISETSSDDEKYQAYKVVFWNTSKLFNYDEVSNISEVNGPILVNENLLFSVKLNEKKINLFDIKFNKSISEIDNKLEIKDLILSKNGKYLVIFNSDYSINVWNTHTLTLMKKFPKTKKYFDYISITPNNKYVVVYSSSLNIIGIYDFSNGNIINIIKRKEKSANFLQVTNENIIIVNKNKISFLNINSGQIINELINDSQIKKLLLDSNEKELLVYNYNNKIKLFNIQSGNLIKEFLLPKYKYPIDSISLSKNKKIVCGYSNAKIKIFNYNGKFLMNLIDINNIEMSHRSEGGYYKILELNRKRLISFYETLKIWTILDFSTKTIEKNIKELEQQLQAKLDGVTLKPTKIPYTKPLWSKYHPNYWLNIIEDKKAKQKDKIEAMYQLGIIYDRDNQNQEALKWYKKAMQAGHKEAKKRLEFLTNWLKKHTKT